MCVANLEVSPTMHGMLCLLGNLYNRNGRNSPSRRWPRPNAVALESRKRKRAVRYEMPNSLMHIRKNILAMISSHLRLPCSIYRLLQQPHRTTPLPESSEGDFQGRAPFPIIPSITTLMDHYQLHVLASASLRPQLGARGRQ